MVVESDQASMPYRWDQNWVLFRVHEDAEGGDAFGTGKVWSTGGLELRLISQEAMAKYCSEDARANMMPDIGTAFVIQATISHALSERPQLQPLCFVSRGPDERGERLVLQFTSGESDLDKQLEIWDSLIEWVEERCRELGESHDTDWQEIFSSFSVVVQ